MVAKIKMHPEGPEFSRMIFGAWRMADWGLSTNDNQKLIEQSIELGITTFDHADIYGDYQCEALFGEVLKQAPQLKEQMEIVTKCGIKLTSEHRPSHGFHRYDTSYEHIIWSAENSLKALNIDAIDCLLIHRHDPLMNADEVARAFSDLKQQGKVKHFGVSNHLPHQFNLLQSRLDFPLVTNQVEVSILHTDAMYDGSLDQCQQLNVAPMAWSPLAQGRLFTGTDEQSKRVQVKLAELSSHYGVTVDQLAYAWLLRHPSRIVPITGSGKIERVASAIKAFDVQMSDDHWFEILAASQGHEVP